MEEEKAAALYDELTRKGEGAARFKQGLGFSSSSNDAIPSRGSALPSSSSSFLSQFVKASSNSSTTAEREKQSQLSSIQDKLKKKPLKSQTRNLDSDVSPRSRLGRSPDDHCHSSRRRRSPDNARHSKRRSRSRSRSRDRHQSRRRSRSRERSRHSRRSGSRGRDESNHSRRRSPRHRQRSRSESPRGRRGEDSYKGRREKQKSGKGDYAELIEGYDKMTPAEKVKAKMKLQLTVTAEKDEKNGMGSGWERFDFDKDAPLDDEEIEAVEDDAALVKRIGQTFRFSSLEAKREEELKAAHDEAMFGAPSISSPTGTDNEEEAINVQRQNQENVTSLLSEQVLTMQKVSWRDRVSRS